MNYEEILTTLEAKENFIKGLICLAKIDGVISQEEHQYFIDAAFHMGLTQQQVDKINDCIEKEDEIAIKFNSLGEKVFFLREAVQLCAIDVCYTSDEKKEVRRLAQILEVPSSILDEVEAWVEEGMKWKQQGDDMIKKYL